MKNNFISHHNRPLFSTFLDQKEKSINSIINNLKISDVKDDSQFNITRLSIKDAIIPKPVKFAEPAVINHTYEEIQLTFQQQVAGGLRKDHYYHEIKFPFTGSIELFSYSAGGYSYSSSDLGLIAPNYNSVTIFIDLPELDPKQAIANARTTAGLTLRLVEDNNSSLDRWTSGINQKIDDLLDQKRKELIKKFS